MTTTPNPPPTPESGPSAPQGYPPVRSHRARTLWLAIGIPVGVILLLALSAVVALALWGLAPAEDVNANATLDNAQSVVINAPNARMELLPSADDQVHVTLTGTYTGPAPRFETRVDGAAARIDAVCSDRRFTRCDLKLTVAIPASLDVSATGMNGHIILKDLSGDIRLETLNGSVDVTGTSGRLDLVTVNGEITVQEAVSDRVTAKTVNGSVELTFRSAPSAVTATSTNGSITVNVPGDGTSYAVTATTVLGKVDTGAIPTDPAARNTITVETVNGSITVGAVGR